MTPLDNPVHTPMTPDLPVARGALDLTAPEKLLLWAVRTWVHSLKRHGRTGSALAAGLEPAGCVEVAEPLNDLMTVAAASAHRRLAVHSPCCPCLAHDEQRLLALVAAQQNGQNADIYDIAAPLLHCQALSRCLPALKGLGAALAANGLFLPLRPWSFWPEQPGLTHPAPRSCARDQLL